MKQLFRTFVSVVLIACISSVAAAAEDIRLSRLRDGDDMIPTLESVFFTRYTPWFKTLHLTTSKQVNKGLVGGEGCQQIRCFDISPVDNDTILAGSDTTGVWITKNGGEHWYNTNRNIIPFDVADVLCHPEDKNIMLAYFYGTNENYDSNKPGIYRSVDGGKNWNRTLTDYISSSKIDKLFACDNDGNIYAVTGQGVVKSTDDGATWNVVLAPALGDSSSLNNMVPAVSISVSPDGNNVVACYSKYTYDSATGTSNQSSYSLSGINVGIFSDGVWQWDTKNISTDSSVSALAVQSYSPLKMIASYYDYATEKYGLSVTKDGGNTWTAFNDSNGTSYQRINPNVPIKRIKLNDSRMYVAYDRADKAFRYLDISEIDNVASTKSWVAVNLKEIYTESTEILTEVENMYIAAGFDICEDFLIIYANSGINKFDFNNNTWSRISGGYSGLSVSHFNIADDGNMILSRADGNIVVSDSAYTANNIPTFTGMPGPGRTHATMTLRDLSDAEGDRYIVWNGNYNSTKSKVGIIVTEDGGATYVDKDNNVLAMTEDGGKYYPNRVSDPIGMNTHVLEYDAEDKNTIYSSCAISYDNGDTWELNDYFILDICDDDSNKIMAWDIYGENATYYIMYSSDGGKTWASLYRSTYTDNKSDNTRGFFDKADSNRFYLMSNFGLGVIDISTGSFMSKNHSFGCGNAILRQNPEFPNHLLLGTQNYDTANLPSLLESLDGGETWHVVPGLFGARVIKEIQFSKTTNEAFLGSHNGTVIYEYDNFWHYTTATLTDGTQTVSTWFDVYKDSNGKKFILSPPQIFDTGEKIFSGWKYTNKLYQTGEKIYID